MQLKSPNQSASWICCQLGAREHYAIPRALIQRQDLLCLITDAWITPQSLINLLPQPWLANLRERFHSDLAQAPGYSFTSSLIQFELSYRLRESTDWQRTLARNYWFQQHAIRTLKTIYLKADTQLTIFAYSYAALEIFRYAKAQGWRTVLGQIDPGIVDEKLIMAHQTDHPSYEPEYQPAPADYWSAWREECALADRVIVNSNWSSQALQQTGIPAHKIDIIPLAYQPIKQAASFVRTYPTVFSSDRPLRVLFLGQVILRKGIAAILEAAESLREHPIEFWIVGGGIAKPPVSNTKIRWIGAVPRSRTSHYYQMADIFLFPTLSDGFGLTQLEAQAWRLPIIASSYCGEVVTDQVNGIVLKEVTGEAIAKALLLCLNHPQILDSFSQNAIDLNDFGLVQLGHCLQTLPYASA